MSTRSLARGLRWWSTPPTCSPAGCRRVTRRRPYGPSPRRSSPGTNWALTPRAPPFATTFGASTPGYAPPGNHERGLLRAGPALGRPRAGGEALSALDEVLADDPRHLGALLLKAEVL